MEEAVGIQPIVLNKKEFVSFFLMNKKPACVMIIYIHLQIMKCNYAQVKTKGVALYGPFFKNQILENNIRKTDAGPEQCSKSSALARENAVTPV